MSELRNFEQDQSLKFMSQLNEQSATVQALDVTDAVMSRVHAIEQRIPERKRMLLRPRFAVPAAASFLVLGVSLSGYAASQFIEFRNSQAEMILNTNQAPPATKFGQRYTDLFQMYSKQVNAQLQPGDYAAYYVKDDIIAKADQANPVKFEYKIKEFPSFSSLQDEIQRTQAPVLNYPSQLPAGYRYEYGYVHPEDLYPQRSKNAEYRMLTEELVGQSKASASDDKLFLKKMSWSKADATSMRFSKGKDDYVVVMAHSIPADSGLTTVIQGPYDTAEKLSIRGTEAYYIASTEDKLGSAIAYSRNRLGWKDEKRGLLIEIYDSPSSQLTRQDLVQMAASMLSAP
ncbi:DUF4367 domain-containing protein [Paenibacillus sp. JX-17]|uniref:DUF4367 domain-containing protein n=1 Tax=Paenibacillus lacisoli TaxID=3064525 RepID=A0ABT9CBS1_9BACL|nr:DUF4367 domain-containing protein [Paenibacillus sp. JX-17]MDO7906704.1 DUF4367 domain-containing protein [Paenibacillus sp. JX-17]